jgi:hypothetical protein
MAENARSAEAEVREKLVRLQQLKTKLDESDAQISQMYLPAVETTLSSLRLGVPISLKIREEANGVFRYLRFEKVAKVWRLCVVEELQDGDIHRSESTPLSDVPRDDRAEIFELFLPGILDAALRSMEGRVERRQKSIGAAKTLVETVGKITGENAASDSGTGAPIPTAQVVIKVPQEKVVVDDGFLNNPLFKAVLAVGEAVTKANVQAPKGNSQVPNKGTTKQVPPGTAGRKL